MNKDCIVKIYDMGLDIRRAESLSRALLTCMENNNENNQFDAENLAEILLILLENLRKNFNEIDKLIVNSARGVTDIDRF